MKCKFAGILFLPICLGACRADVVDLSETKVFVPLNSLSAQFLTESSEGPELVKSGAKGEILGGFGTYQSTSGATKPQKVRRGLITLSNKNPLFYQTGTKAHLTKVAYSALADLASSSESADESPNSNPKPATDPNRSYIPGTTDRSFSSGLVR